MIFFYIRHGDPTYNPNALTPLGKRQAEAVAKKLALYGIDEIYSSTSNRAVETAQPTCEILKKEVTQLDFCNESHAWAELTVERDGKKRWLWADAETRRAFCEPSVIERGHRWYEDERFRQYKKGIDRIYDDTDAFFKKLGYEHIRGTGRYKIIEPNDKRVALFAHQGFGHAFFSTVLDIPYPIFCIHFEMCHSGMSVIEFREEDGYAIPQVLTLSSDAHLYREGLPTNYNNRIRF